MTGGIGELVIMFLAFALCGAVGIAVYVVMGKKK